MEYDVTDVEYLRHGTTPLLARLYIPRGKGTFRCVVEVHGGVWTLNDRTHTEPVHIALAQAGIAVAALDFRQGAEGAYPLSVADVHYGIRWTKANAHLLKSRSDLVGICSQSSGAHIAALLVIRPHDSRYGATPMGAGLPEVDATVRCLAMFWPVVNPLGRYRYAKYLSAQPNPPDWAIRHIPLHDAYWKTEANMREGSPLFALEQGEGKALPPALWLQPRVDPQHIYEDPASPGSGTDLEKFIAAYRRTGASIEIEYYDAPQYFTTVDPRSGASKSAFARVVGFFQRHIPDPALRE